MGNHGKRRKFRRYLRGNIDYRLQLGVIAGNDVVDQLVADTVVDTTWCSSVKATWTLDNWTKGEGIGPIMVGIAHSDYTDAEIEEWIENATNWDVGDLRVQEIGRRKIRIVGTFSNPDTSSESAQLSEGRQITAKVNMMLNEGDTLQIWAYNTGSQAHSATTNPNLRVQGHANLWPK